MGFFRFRQKHDILWILKKLLLKNNHFESRLQLFHFFKNRFFASVGWWYFFDKNKNMFQSDIALTRNLEISCFFLDNIHSSPKETYLNYWYFCVRTRFLSEMQCYSGILNSSENALNRLLRVYYVVNS